MKKSILFTILVFSLPLSLLAQNSELDNPPSNIGYEEARKDLPKTVIIREHAEDGVEQIVATNVKADKKNSEALANLDYEPLNFGGDHELDNLNGSESFYYYYRGRSYPYANYYGYNYYYRPYYSWYSAGFYYSAYTWYRGWWY